MQLPGALSWLYAQTRKEVAHRFALVVSSDERREDHLRTMSSMVPSKTRLHCTEKRGVMTASGSKDERVSTAGSGPRWVIRRRRCRLVAESVL
jgi:hypothetical protein